MMYGNNGGGWMGGGWVMLIGALVCIALVGVVIWLVMRSLNNKQATPLSSLPQQHFPYQMNGQGYQPPPQQSSETYQEGEMQYSYPQQEQPVN
jgi:predicted lipid-binding transport protein (Tim44 family)